MNSWQIIIAGTARSHSDRLATVKTKCVLEAY